MNHIREKWKPPHLDSWLPAAVGAGLVLGSWVVTSNFSSNSLFAQSTDANEPAVKWVLRGSNPADYRTGVDTRAVHQGKASAYLQSATTTKSSGFGTMMQTIDAANYAGMRVRLRASVKSENVADWAGVWMRVDKEPTTVAFDNMQDRPIKGTQPWKTYDVVLDVPLGATRIAFGILLSGSGKVWMNQVKFETVGKETKVTGTPFHSPFHRPASRNLAGLSFEEVKKKW